MRTVTLDVRPLAETLDNFVHAWQTGKASSPRISFESPALLFKVLTGKRWELLNALTGAGPLTIREAARRVARDVNRMRLERYIACCTRCFMGRVVLTRALEAEFDGFRSPLEVCDSEGKAVGLFLPLANYKELLANLEIPYSAEELERRRQEKGGSSLEDFWRTVGR